MAVAKGTSFVDVDTVVTRLDVDDDGSRHLHVTWTGNSRQTIISRELLMNLIRAANPDAVVTEADACPSSRC